MKIISSHLLLFLLFLNLTFNAFSDPLHDNNNNNNKPLPLQPAVIVGTVFCDTCFQQQHLSKSLHFISGARVGVECIDEKTSNIIFKQQVKTNKNGKFRVGLPFSVGKHIKKIERCSVKLIKSSEPFCSLASSATSSSLHLKNSKNKNGVRIFSAGFFSFKPLEQPTLCNKKNTDVLKSKQINPQLPIPPFFPPIVPPIIPSPSFLPPNPLQPAPLIPNPFQPPAPLIPNPFQPPAPLIPNPLQPPTPVIPMPFVPTPGPVLPLPPLPFITPPPPPVTLLPPFLPPIPGISPGPPREENSSPIKKSP